jgi:hypothetical protein
MNPHNASALRVREGAWRTVSLIGSLKQTVYPPLRFLASRLPGDDAPLTLRVRLGGPIDHAENTNVVII